MKQLIILILCTAVVCSVPFFLPPKQPAALPQTEESEEVAPEIPEAPPEEPFDSRFTLRVLAGETVNEMSLREYLVGVLFAEMPSDFPEEALKAQAVAARTFALKKAEAGKHPTADVCTDSACCQGYLECTDEDILNRLQGAIDATDGLVITYGDELIDATFFSCSDGKTESAAEVWGSDIPYLQSVESPGEENAPPYTQTVVLEADYFSEVLEGAYPQINLSGNPLGWFGAESRTEGGGIDTVFIGGTAVSGTELRRLFSLRSTDISFSPSETEITVTTCGFGHRVGMSQYGAKAMAENGIPFYDILTHYYSGTSIKKLLLRNGREA